MRWRVALAGLILTGGCTADRMPPPPPPASTTAAPQSRFDDFSAMPRLGPSDREIAVAYGEYQRRLSCPEQATCGPPAPRPVGMVECSLEDSIEIQRCSFVISSRPYGKRDLYRCEAVFQNDRDVWRIERMIGDCEVAVWHKVP